LRRTITDNIPLTEARYKDSSGERRMPSRLRGIVDSPGLLGATIAKVGPYLGKSPSLGGVPEIARP